MHADRNVRIDLHQCVDQPCQNDVVGIGARTAAGLKDDGRIGLVRRGHDGQTLFHVADVEGRHAIVVFGGMIE